MARYPRLMPAQPQLFTASVLRSSRLSPSFQRVTIGGPALADFDWRGFDSWFRLFLPSPGVALRLPKVSGRSWWPAYLLIPEAQRPHCANYTVADFRPEACELDIDVVLHWHDGALAGRVARWAAEATPGQQVGLLDQGLMFDPPAGSGRVLLAADETGLPGVLGILAGLPAETIGAAVLEVPEAGDVREVTAPPGMGLTWLPRTDGQAPGALALAALSTFDVRPDDYAYLVGESSLATGARRLLRKAGLPTSQITFSGFWKAASH
ncbi:NADPH-dependent ferric siderophore reductase [Propionicimonas paludicola]|uniref:NADPH-dependent ferric siderophore reductase n=1 Tax=Propionicimonas paludicola TaxID=185243 RepID=A0A2A9CMP0_9ACTN|nr:siderophore-interacting protein [Propionicimonas paludicola]PFG15588.1 NADPH-dependent ferric siderophore reductase [Propionicimonas paludicola]